MKVAHCLTGSIATKLAQVIQEAYIEAGLDSKLEAAGPAMQFSFFATNSAIQFIPSTYGHFVDSKSGRSRVFTDQDEWDAYHVDKTVLHIETVKNADVLVIAPCSANTLAKLAHGICDNLVTCIARAWPLGKPIVIAPAMNTQMWHHPATQEHLTTLQRWWPMSLHILKPISKTLFCGDVGVGAMESVDLIVQKVLKVAKS